MIRILNDEKMLLEGYSLAECPELVSQNNRFYLINESGLYHITLKSRKPEAIIFHKWVTNDIVPSIHQTEKYEIQRQPQKDSFYSLPPHKQAIEVVDAVRHVLDTLYDQPRLQQYIIDHSVSSIFEQKALPGNSELRLRGVVEIAEDMGSLVTLKRSSSFN
jgi:hypothetical protein